MRWVNRRLVGRINNEFLQALQASSVSQPDLAGMSVTQASESAFGCFGPLAPWLVTPSARNRLPRPPKIIHSIRVREFLLRIHLFIIAYYNLSFLSYKLR